MSIAVLLECERLIAEVKNSTYSESSLATAKTAYDEMMKMKSARLKKDRIAGVYWGWTAEQRRTLIRMYEDGSSAKEISAVIGKCEQEITTEASFYGLLFRNQKNRKNVRKKSLTQEQINQIYAYRESGISIKNIERLMRCGYEKISHVLRDENVPFADRRRNVYTDADIEEIRSLRSSGMSIEEIAYKTRRAWKTIKVVMHDYSIP